MILFYTLCLFAATPRFREPVPVLCKGVPIDVGRYGVPAMGDLDGDGNKDFVAGEFDSGFVRFYPNVGPDSWPVFDTFYLVEASGSRIRLPNRS